MKYNASFTKKAFKYKLTVPIPNFSPIWTGFKASCKGATTGSGKSAKHALSCPYVSYAWLLVDLPPFIANKSQCFVETGLKNSLSEFSHPEECPRRSVVLFDRGSIVKSWAAPAVVLMVPLLIKAGALNTELGLEMKPSIYIYTLSLVSS